MTTTMTTTVLTVRPAFEIGGTCFDDIRRVVLRLYRAIGMFHRRRLPAELMTLRGWVIMTRTCTPMELRALRGHKRKEDAEELELLS
jgi:hypothetical protein